MARIDAIDVPKLLMTEGAAPSTPASTKVYMYAKADGLLYSKDDAGTETLMSSGLASSSTTPPTFVAAGAQATGTGAVVPALYTGHTTNDIIVVAVQSNNQTVVAPTDYVQMGPQPGIGTAAAAAATRLALFWKRHDGSESDPSVPDSGDHTLAFTFGIRGCPTTGDPFRSVGQTAKRTASTTSTGAAGATPTDNCLVVQVFATALDSASAAFSVPTNASLSSVTERADEATADGNGGGIGLITGLLATAGSFVATTATVTSTVDVGSCVYFLPSGYVNKGDHVDRQVFLTPGFADTWTKPSGAKWVTVTAIGGGASGSAGRNAATASGGGGGSGGSWMQNTVGATQLGSTVAVTAGAGGAATANSDGAASNAGAASSFGLGSVLVVYGQGGGAAAAAASGAGGAGGTSTNGQGSNPTTAPTSSFGSQGAGGGVGGTTAGAGAPGVDFAGGGGAGGGTSQAASAGGTTARGGGGGGGGRSNTNVGTGGTGVTFTSAPGGSTASAAGTDSPYPEFGGGGAAGGTSASGSGGTGGFPGGGGGGGGSQSGAQGGGKGGDGVVVIITFC